MDPPWRPCWTNHWIWGWTIKGGCVLQDWVRQDCRWMMVSIPHTTCAEETTIITTTTTTTTTTITVTTKATSYMDRLRKTTLTKGNIQPKWSHRQKCSNLSHQRQFRQVWNDAEHSDVIRLWKCSTYRWFEWRVTDCGCFRMDLERMTVPERKDRK